MPEQPRHGARTARPVRPLLPLALFPAALVAMIGVVVLAYLLRSPGAHSAPTPAGGALWGVLTAAALLASAVVAGAAVIAAGESGTHAATAFVGERGLSRGDRRVELFVDLARRVQNSVHRQLEYLQELADETEDPELLQGLFYLDHQAARIRRHAENLALLGGSVPRRLGTRPVRVSELLRSCVAEVEHYARVRLVHPLTGTVRGHAAADVVHLLAELVENATAFSAPQTQVVLRAQQVTSGLAIEVEDRGLGMTLAEQSRLNAVLAGTGTLDAADLLGAGRVGLFAVSTLAGRHKIAVRLQSNVYGGVQAVVVLPRELLEEDTECRPPAAVLATAEAPQPAEEPPRR